MTQFCTISPSDDIVDGSCPIHWFTSSESQFQQAPLHKKIEQDTQNYIKDLNEAIQVDQGEYCKKPYRQAEKEIATVQLILKMDIWIVKINRRVSFT